MSARVDWLHLLSLPDTGRALARQVRSVVAAEDVGFGDEIRRALREHPANREAHGRSRARAEAALRFCEEEGLQLLVPGDPSWPTPLDSLRDPPFSLVLEGVLPASPLVAFSGTREPDASGLGRAERLTEALAEPLTIAGGHHSAQDDTGQGSSEIACGVVTGLARGLDSRVQETGLAHGLPSVAVRAGCLRAPLGGERRSLVEGLLAGGGAQLSECWPGEPTRRYAFVRRNRIIAALSFAVVLLQGATQSGTLHTARAAIALRRPIGIPDDALRSTAPQDAGLRTLAAPWPAGDAHALHMKSAPRMPAPRPPQLDLFADEPAPPVHRILDAANFRDWLNACAVRQARFFTPGKG